MTWKRIEPPSGTPAAFAGTLSGATLVFRGIESAFACDPGAATVAWETHFGAGSMAVGSKAIEAIPRGRAATLVHVDADESKAVGIEGRSGDPVWEQPLGLSPVAYGFGATGEHVVAFGSGEGSRGRLVALSAADGAVVAAHQTEPANGIRVAGGRVFLAARTGGIFSGEVGSPPGAVADLKGEFTASDGASFYALGRTPSLAIVAAFDGASGEESARVEVPAAPGESFTGLFPSGVAGRVLVVSEQSSRLVDVEENGAVSPVRLPAGQRVSACAGTPHGLAVLRFDGWFEGSAAVYDPASGELLQELEVTGSLPDGIFYLGENLVVSGGGNLHFFQWEA